MKARIKNKKLEVKIMKAPANSNADFLILKNCSH